MPTSGPTVLTLFCEKIMHSNLQSVLDVGCGFGKYGFLAREYTDIWYDRYNKDEWITRIDGVEIWSNYITKLHYFIYTNIYLMDAISFFNEKIEIKYDLIVCADVLEHFEKEKGSELLGLIKKNSKKAFVILPIIVSNQKIVCGNPYEEHKSKWNKEELEKYGSIMILGNTYFLEMKGA